MTDHILAGNTWAFDSDVTEVFDDMLSRSIPGYEDMREVTTALALKFLGEPGRVVDLGAARGEALARLLAVRPEAEAIAVEVSPPMLDAAKQRLASYKHAHASRIDLRLDYPEATDVDVVLAVLTLQFIPIEHRWRILHEAEQSLRPGGALLLVEKVLGSSYPTDQLLVETYYDRKRLLGYSDEEITRKRLSLEGVLVPVTAEANERMLAAAGFGPVERVWQSLNFAGWLAIRG